MKPQNAPTEHSRPYVFFQSSEVSLGKILEHRLLQLGLSQKLFVVGILLLQLGQSADFPGMHAPILLFPAVASRLRHLDDAAVVSDRLPLGDQLLSDFELAKDLHRYVPGAFHNEVA